MRIIRIKAYIIDFIILFCALFLINALIPSSDELDRLRSEQNEIVADRLNGSITMDEYTERYGEVFYKIALEERLPYLLYFLFMISYFVVIPHKWKGRTVGCFLCNVQIERFDSGKLKLWQLMVRYSFVFGLGYVFINNILIMILSNKNYFPVISVVAVFQVVLAIFCAIMVLIRTEKRGLHELASNTELTKIIETNKKRN